MSNENVNDRVIEALKPCPFCGCGAKVFEHGYSDDYIEVGCDNESCPVHPRSTATPKSYPWDDTKKTFWIDWDTAEKHAIADWNRRTPAETVSREAIALHRIYRMVSEVVANPSDNDMETFVKIMTDIETLQLPAPQPVSTGEADRFDAWWETAMGPNHLNVAQLDLIKAKCWSAWKASRPPVPSVVGVPDVEFLEDHPLPWSVRSKSWSLGDTGDYTTNVQVLDANGKDVEYSDGDGEAEDALSLMVNALNTHLLTRQQGGKP